MPGVAITLLGKTSWGMRSFVSKKTSYIQEARALWAVGSKDSEEIATYLVLCHGDWYGYEQFRRIFGLEEHEFSRLVRRLSGRRMGVVKRKSYDTTWIQIDVKGLHKARLYISNLKELPCM